MTHLEDRPTTHNKRLTTKKKSLPLLSFGFVIGCLLLVVGLQVAHADVPVREQNLRQGLFPGWTIRFDACTDYQESFENFFFDLEKELLNRQLNEEASREVARIIKAREDVNKLVASVYNELRSQQIVLDFGQSVAQTLQTLGIAVEDDDGQEICKASYEVKADVGGVQECVAVAQEARIITNADDYIYEEPRRRAMDMLFCYLGDWRHFAIARETDATNCEALGLGSACSVDELWEELGRKVKNDANFYDDPNGQLTVGDPDDDRHVFNLCEGLRALGQKCAQDVLRDFVKYSTIDKITRKDRTLILAPPQTWYTYERCRILDSFLPNSFRALPSPGTDTPYSKKIKSLDLRDADPFSGRGISSSWEIIENQYNTRFGNPTLGRLPSDMLPVNRSVATETEAISIPENSFTGLASKAEQLATQIINEMTELRKLQYASGEGLREATLRIGWKDYEWANGSNALGSNFLSKYDALDLNVGDPKKPNKVFKPLACYWGSGCNDSDIGIGVPSGKTFYFDTGIILSPTVVIKDKLQAAIQAQFDLARDTFALPDTNNEPFSRYLRDENNVRISGCNNEVISWVAPSVNALPAPFEDQNINLANTINPLTGQDYTQESLIPELPGNYFNVLYNEVFQLYHTPFAHTLAKWFRVSDPPTYESIYQQITGGTPLFASAGPTGSTPATTPGPGGAAPPPPPAQQLPVGCNAYDSDFQATASSEGVNYCLLKAIASAESSCNPNAQSGAGACGIMQLLPASASSVAGRPVSCQELKNNPQLSMQLAARYLKQSASVLGGYQSKGFSIGNTYEQSGSTVTYGPYNYDTANDDLIASYNAGWGGGTTAGGQKQAFATSSDCQNPVTPAWQCNINPGGFLETQRYVVKVQQFQAQCQP